MNKDTETYADVLAANYREKQKQILGTIFSDNGPVFPNRKNPSLWLNDKEELILKTIFMLKVGFLEEFEFLMAFCFTKTKLESTIIDLEKQGYIVSNVSKDYGKYFILTKEALFYFYCPKGTDFKSVTFSEDRFPSSQKLILYKCLNGYISSRVLKKNVDNLYGNYNKESTDFKRMYQKMQFLQNVLYHDSKETTVYSSSAIAAFANEHYDDIEDKPEVASLYKSFISFLKANRDDSFLYFNFLKDYYASASCQSINALAAQRTKHFLHEIFSNIYRSFQYPVREELIRLSFDGGAKDSLVADRKLYLLNECSRIFQIARRSVMNTNITESNKEETETKINQLKAELDKCEKRKATYEGLLTFSLFDGFKNDIAYFTEDVITFEGLRQAGVYIIGKRDATDGEKPAIEFGIFPTSDEEMSISYIFSRIEKIFQISYHLLQAFRPQVIIFVYNRKSKASVEEKLVEVKKQFECITEYSMALSYFDEMKIETCENHFKERHLFFKSIRPLLGSGKTT